MLALSFRAKLTSIVVTAAVAFAVMIVSSSLIANRSDREIEKIQQRHLPKMELAPQIEADFERLRRALQDAVGARDIEALSATRALYEQIVARLAAAREVIEPKSLDALTQALDEYYQAASEVSRRLIVGETGEGLVSAMSAMQAMQVRVTEDLKTATRLDRGELARAFAAAARAQITAGRVRFAISALCLLSVILLSFWVGRDLLRSLDALAAGLARFGRGDFARPIQGVGADELGDVAQQANRMADSLRRMEDQREQASWLKNLEAGLGQELRAALDPAEVAGRAVPFLARALEARAAALYYADPGPALRLLGHYALSPAPAAAEAAAPSFAPGEGLVGQAALQEQVMLIDDPPPDYLRVRSGLGESAPRVIALVPLVHVGKVSGVLELALFSPWSERSAEAVQAVQEMLVIAIEVARSRAATRQLLAETQRQAQRLTEQEEELRAANEELQSQQHELKQSNRELTNQADELEAQRTKLEESNTELDEARRGLEHKARELATVSAYKSQFLANMSHELRTPLNSMLLLSNLLAENQGRNLTAKQVEFAATIYGAGKDLLALINQVLDLAKIESGKSEVQIAPAPLRDLVTSMERVFAPLAADKGLSLRTEIAPDLPESIATDRRRVEQILKNLIGNAIKFTERGEVVVRLGFPAPSARIQRLDLHPRRTLALSVSDTGVGIAPEHRERVFVPFEQVDSAPDRRYGGTGLGLSISRELAALLGGELQLESVVGRGSVFTCFLPFDPPAASATAAPPATVPSPSPGVPSPSPSLFEARGARGNGSPGAPAPAAPGDCLLIIEDDPSFGEALADIIRGQGLECLLADDGESGLRLARERHPAGIILDVTLPDMDGWRIMEQLRSDPATASIPVHFVSGVDAPERGMALGAVGYLTKPAAPDELARAVRALGVKGTEHARRVLVVEDDAVVGEALVRQLSGEKLEVQRAGSAAEARAALEAQRFGCMILDLSLPDMDGLRLLRALRERHGAHMPAVVIYTARSLSDEETRTLEAYAEAVVLKDGASAERLLEEVRVFVQRVQDGRGSSKRVASPRSPSDVQLDGKKVLIVDDDMRTVYALSATLRAKGADVAVAEDGQVALSTLADRPDLQAVLMDIMMPGMDGYETIRRIRLDPRHRNLPIIALTAKAMKGDQEQCLAAGASDYLPKPVDVDRLLALLDKLLSPRPTPAAPAVPGVPVMS